MTRVSFAVLGFLFAACAESSPDSGRDADQTAEATDTLASRPAAGDSIAEDSAPASDVSRESGDRPSRALFRVCRVRRDGTGTLGPVVMVATPDRVALYADAGLPESRWAGPNGKIASRTPDGGAWVYPFTGVNEELTPGHDSTSTDTLRRSNGVTLWPIAHDSLFALDRPYHVFGATGPAGTASVVRWTVDVGYDAYILGEASLAEPDAADVLWATNDRYLATDTSPYREKTAAEEQAWRALADSVLRAMDAPGDLVEQAETPTTLVAVRLAAEAPHALLGSIVIKDVRERSWAVLLLAEHVDDTLSATLVWQQHGGEASGWERHVLGARDLDADGQLEIITETVYWETSDYVIYKKVSDEWQVVYQGDRFC